MDVLPNHLLPRAEKGIPLVGQGLSLAISRPKGLPYTMVHLGYKQFDALFNDSWF
jgi:hypothetical protein